ncbi:MFS transporter [Hymenobacter terrenus]|uniref:MFS transporter n=1 Tax=Hymenobacter terrenus TaxID=1629124 RepID=UPI00069853C0|nr:MFS transporter [Hymenobacter terrenus]
MQTGFFRAFRSRNYRLFFAGQSLSLLGTWMQKTAVSWVIYTQTHSEFMLGLSVFASIFPSALLSLLGGIVTDRYPAYRILLLTQVLSMAQAALLALAVWVKPHAVWEILGLSAVLGLINAFDLPARQSLVYGLAEDKQDLPAVVAMSSSMVNAAQLLGPVVAGFVLARLGATTCFGLNALSFVAVIGSMVAMRLPPMAAPATGRNLRDDLSAGFRYLQATPDIRFIIVMMALLSLLVLPFTTLLPAYAKDVFQGTATTPRARPLATLVRARAGPAADAKHGTRLGRRARHSRIGARARGRTAERCADVLVGAHRAGWPSLRVKQALTKAFFKIKVV